MAQEDHYKRVEKRHMSYISIADVSKIRQDNPDSSRRSIDNNSEKEKQGDLPKSETESNIVAKPAIDKPTIEDILGAGLAQFLVKLAGSDTQCVKRLTSYMFAETILEQESGEFLWQIKPLKQNCIVKIES